jgi:XTP/dITP diphosphohydrolase
MRQIVLASSNRGKLAELRDLLAALPFTIVSQSQFGVAAAEETGPTFVENAIIKARHAAAHTGLAAIADDSGLEVDVLHGAPGVYSARFAGTGATDVMNNTKLLSALAGIPDEAREARFVCVVVYMRHADDPMPIICSGIWKGHILKEPQGNYGFGYDPLFYVPTHGCAAAELPSHIKNRISHRAQALRRLVRVLKSRQRAEW